MLICISVASARKPLPGDDILQVSKGGLEATLRIENCGEKNVVTIEWKNTNSHSAVGILSLNSKFSHEPILAITVAVPANHEKTETCESIDAGYRSVGFTTFSDVQAELTLVN